MADMRIAIGGLGTIGRALARRLVDGVPGLTLACVAARDEEKARGWLDEEGIEVPITALDEFPDHADLAVECAVSRRLRDPATTDQRGLDRGLERHLSVIRDAHTAVPSSADTRRSHICRSDIRATSICPITVSVIRDPRYSRRSVLSAPNSISA